ncbi:MAG: YjcZ family sporulation protein [Erysipelotrichaceae bacterium]|nr:YjcZ family sporulation protein [Erysipelotrichaceae bacterium]
MKLGILFLSIKCFQPNYGYALILVLFIILVIIGTARCY